MNYRIDLTRTTIENYIKNEEFKLLYKNDQLANEREFLRVFEGFKEHPINFAPTYKFDIGTQNFDSSDKMRKPAWLFIFIFLFYYFIYLFTLFIDLFYYYFILNLFYLFNFYLILFFCFYLFNFLFL